MNTMILMMATLPLLHAPSHAAAPRQARLEASGTLRAALEAPRSPETRLDELLAAATTAADGLDGSRAARVLEQLACDARWKAVTDAGAALSWLETQLAQRAEDLAFTPLVEADLPRDFPAPTPVLEIERKRYPAYRMARTPMKSFSTPAFWTLFRHIERHGIPMTAPVEQTYGHDARLRGEQMAFLYASSEVGDTGPDGSVEVIDVPSGEVVSLGLRGNLTTARIAEAREELLDWIQSRGDLEVVGKLRTMGYNSPMVPAGRRTFEVQIPVRALSTRTLEI